MTGRARSHEDGSILIESIVALAVVAVLVAAVHDLHRGAVRARAMASATTAALHVASSGAAMVRAGIPVPPEIDVEEVGIARAWTDRDCVLAPEPVHRLVRARVDGRPDDPAGEVVLRVSGPDPTPPPHVVRVVLPDGSAASGVVLHLEDPVGGIRRVETDPSGCVRFEAGPLPVLVTVEDAASVRSVTSISTAGVTTTVGLRRQGSVRLLIASPGRPPEVVEDGALTWWARGSPGVAAIGGALPLPAGPHRVVLGTCEDPRATGTTVPVDVAPDGDAVVEVALGIVRVVRPATDDGRRLVLRRQRPCPGSGSHPTLGWRLGGGGGELLAAVPDGAWEARLLDAASRTLMGPTTVLVGGDATTIEPWS